MDWFLGRDVLAQENFRLMQLVHIGRKEIEQSDDVFSLFQSKGLRLNDPRYFRIMSWDQDSDVFTYKVMKKERVKLKDIVGLRPVEHG